MDATRIPAYTRELTAFLHALGPRDLPGEVLDRARYFLLDYLAVAIRGSREESARAAQRMVQKTCPSTPATGGATIFGTPIVTHPGHAAFTNGTSSHSIEMDDTHSGGSIHLGTTMFSAALALAEAGEAARGDDFLAAVVAGYEMAARIAMAAQPQQQYALGFHPTPACGVFGAAIAAGKMLRLSEEQLRSAVGIAGSMAAGSMEFLADGAWTKRIHPGLAAQNGIQAALLAAEGFLGPGNILEGRDGFLRGYSRDPVPARLTADLGKSYEILRTAVKPHACCRYMQGPIDAVLDIVRSQHLEPARIRSIEIAVLSAGWGLVAEPAERKYDPRSVVDTQFSMPFGAAVAAVRGAAGLDEFTLEQIMCPEVRATMSKVKLIKNPGIEATYPREWPARVVIETDDGRRHERFVRHPKGDPENPLTWDEMVAKFRTLAGSVLPAERCEEIIAQVSKFAEPSAVARLCGTHYAAARG